MEVITIFFFYLYLVLRLEIIIVLVKYICPISHCFVVACIENIYGIQRFYDFFSYISKHQLNFLRPFWDIIPLWNGYSAATYTYLPSITVVAVGETDNTCTCCYTSGIFFPKILPFDIVPDDSNSAFGSNNDQLWLDESSEFSLDWNSVVLHWITRVFGFVMITFFYILNT